MGFDVGCHIRQLREELGWTQADLAARAHIGQGDLSRIERGATDPRRSTVNRIIGALGETLSPTAAPTTIRPALTGEPRQAIRAQAKPRRSTVRAGCVARDLNGGLRSNSQFGTSTMAGGAKILGWTSGR